MLTGNTPGARRASLVRIAVLAVLLTAFVAMAMGAARNDRFPGDERLLAEVQSWGWYRPFAWWGNSFQHEFVVPSGFLLAIVWLSWRRRRPAALFLLAAAPLSFSGDLIKLAVDRPRPGFEYSSMMYGSTAFPSGHVVAATVFYCALLVALAPHLPERAAIALRVAAIAGVVIAMVARVWEGAHWPSDVLGGALWGSAATLGLVVAARALESRRIRKENGTD